MGTWKIEWKKNFMEWNCYENNIITEDMIKEIEEYFNISFPQDFLDVIKNYDCGHPHPNAINIDGYEEILSNIVSFCENHTSYIINIFEDIEDFRDKRLIPIAEDPFGNIFCYRMENNGIDIVFWDHENNEEKYVCNKFSELLALLYD